MMYGRQILSWGFATLCFAHSALAECDTSQIVNVAIRNMQFVPAHIEVCAGQTIRWTNEETTRRSHTVTADARFARDPQHVALPEGAQPFNSGPIAPGQSFEQTLTVAGDYRYFCQPHEMMGHLGSITVINPE